MRNSPTYLDDYADDFEYGLDGDGALVPFGDDGVAHLGFTNFTAVVEANAVYAGVAEHAFQAARLSDLRKHNHAYRATDAGRRKAAHKAAKAADPDGVREATRLRVAKHRAKKRAEKHLTN